MAKQQLSKYVLERVYLPTETLGSIYDSNRDIICKTMELPWRDNRRSANSILASCIPEGTYMVRKEPAKPWRDYVHFRLINVPGRDGILIHKITYVKDLLGCIGVGGKHVDLNKDGVPDMVESTKTLEIMASKLPNEFVLEIKKK